MKKNQIPPHVDFTVVDARTVVAIAHYMCSYTGPRYVSATIQLNKGILKKLDRFANSNYPDPQPCSLGDFYAEASTEMTEEILKLQGLENHSIADDVLYSDDIDQALWDIIDAREIQKKGRQVETPALQWLAIIAERLGLASAHALNCKASGDLPGDVRKLRKELVQIGAFAAAAIESIDTHAGDPEPAAVVILALPAPIETPADQVA